MRGQAVPWADQNCQAAACKWHHISRLLAFTRHPLLAPFPPPYAAAPSTGTRRFPHRHLEFGCDTAVSIHPGIVNTHLSSSYYQQASEGVLPFLPK